MDTRNATQNSPERQTRMFLDRSRLLARSTGRMLAFAVVAGLLASCGTKDKLATGAIPDDYRTRHPIVIAEAERTIDIPVASGDTRLPQGTRDVIRGFAAEYRNASTGVIQIMLPRGSANSHAAQIVRKDIRRQLAAVGVPAKRVIETGYEAGTTGDAAPIRLSYVAIAAQTAPCGEWPEDLALNTLQNRNYYNFGCATQSNLAAQIANPTDLIGPRQMSPIDAEQRGEVINTWRGTDTDNGGTTIIFN